jgi:hypothetical protein
MIKMKLHIVFGVMLVVLFASCKKVDVIEQEETNLAPFNEILMNSSFDLYISEGNEYTVRIEADESIIDYITVDITDSLLTLDNDRKFRWLTPTKNKVKVYVTAPPLKTVTSNKTCFVRTLTPITSDEFGMVFLDKANNADLDLDCDVFYFWNNYPCGGTLTLEGNCRVLKVWSVAIVDVQAENLIAEKAEISNNSKGDCVVRVINELKYTLLGEGDIEVYGQPNDVIEYEPSQGSGELIIH